jgi:hypothetical protein
VVIGAKGDRESPTSVRFGLERRDERASDAA